MVTNKVESGKITTTYPLLKLTIFMLSYFLLCFFQMNQNKFFIKSGIALILGFILCGGLNLAHECLHQTFLKNRKLNTWIGKLFASLLLINFTIYKHHHLEHHKYVGTNKDTESRIQFNTLLDYGFVITGLPMAFAIISKNFKVLWNKYPYYLDSLKKKNEAWSDSLVTYLLLIFLLISTNLFPNFVINCYWIPLGFAYMWILFFGIPEHFKCDSTPQFYSKARSIKSNFLVRYFIWNGNFHAEHHLYPGVSGSNLKHMFILNKDAVFYQEKSYFFFHFKIVSQLINKLS